MNSELLITMKSSTRLITHQRALDALGLLALAALAGVSGCSDSNPASATDNTNTGSETVDGEVITNSAASMADDTMESSTQAGYRLTFNAIWSETTHPLNFTANPHLSGLVGAVHNEQVNSGNLPGLRRQGYNVWLRLAANLTYCLKYKLPSTPVLPSHLSMEEALAPHPGLRRSSSKSTATTPKSA